MFGSHTFKFRSFDPILLNEDEVDTNLDRVLNSLRSKGISVECKYSNRNPHFPEEITLEGEISPYLIKTYFHTGLLTWCPSLTYDDQMLFFSGNSEDLKHNKDKVRSQRMTILRLLDNA